MKFPLLRTCLRTARFYLKAGSSFARMAEKQGGETPAGTCTVGSPGWRQWGKTEPGSPCMPPRVDTRERTYREKCRFLSSRWTTAILNAWIIHHVLLQAIQNSLDPTPGHIAPMHGPGWNPAFLPWPASFSSSSKSLCQGEEFANKGNYWKHPQDTLGGPRNPVKDGHGWGGR